MHFKNILHSTFSNEEVNLFVDMDGVITDYDFGSELNYQDKRPLKTNIKVLKNLSKEENINLYILSICKTNNQIKEKNDWLDKNAPFFLKENRYIISKEKYPNKSSKELKLETLKSILEEKKLKNVALVDDDNGILKYLNQSTLNIKLFQDSSLID